MSWIQTAMLAKELGVHRRTLSRWVNRNDGFPLPRFINGRYYFDREEIEAWKKAIVPGNARVAKNGVYPSGPVSQASDTDLKRSVKESTDPSMS